MTEGCVLCGRPVYDYEPQYCCNGFECGCQGLPVEPPMHESCLVIDYLKRLKQFCKESKEKNMSIGMVRAFPSKTVKLENNMRVISNEDITADEAQYIMDCQGYTNCIDIVADYLIRQLDGIVIEENPDKIESRTKILDL